MTEPARTETDRTAPSRLKTLESGVLTSIPVLSVLVFIVVTLKVFRVSGMETTTTVTVISEADTFALLRGVVVTLLPGFL
jgi:predicted S18 family serine protease